MLKSMTSEKSSARDVLDVEAISKAADKAALDFCVFEHNANSPMSDASLARLFYRHIPNFAKMESEFSEGNKPPQEGVDSANSLATFIEHDMVIGREYSTWLAPHLSKESADLFAEGGRNSLNPVFDKLAEIGGYERSDVLVKEAENDSISDERRRKLQMASQMAAKNMGIGF